MDSAIFGVVVGSMLSLLGNYLQYFLSSRKETKEWERKRKVDEEVWRRTVIRDEQAAMREVYQKSISSLSAVACTTIDHDTELAVGSPGFILVQEASNWLSHVYLRHPSPYLSSKMESFRFSPCSHAKELCDYVVRVAAAEEGLFATERPQVSEPESKYQLNRKRHVSFLVDEEYRRRRLIEDGVEFDRHFQVLLSFGEFTPEQRKLLLESHPEFVRSIPDSYWLPLPEISSGGTAHLSNARWAFNNDPSNTPTIKILQVWEDDYRRALSAIRLGR